MRRILVILAALVLLTGCGRLYTAETSLRIDRSFHRPLEFRLQEEGPNLVLRTIIYSGMGGYQKEPSPVLSDNSRPLTPEEATAVRSSLRAVLASSPTDLVNSSGRDGSMWLFTGSGFWPGRLKVWTPKAEAWLRGTQPLNDFGLLLWRLGKIDEPDKNFY